MNNFDLAKQRFERARKWDLEQAKKAEETDKDAAALHAKIDSEMAANASADDLARANAQLNKYTNVPRVATLEEVTAKIKGMGYGKR